MTELTAQPKLTEEVISHFEKQFKNANFLQLSDKTLCLLRNDEQERYFRNYLKGSKYVIENAKHYDRTDKNDKEERIELAKKVNF